MQNNKYTETDDKVKLGLHSTALNWVLDQNI